MNKILAIALLLLLLPAIASCVSNSLLEAKNIISYTALSAISSSTPEPIPEAKTIAPPWVTALPSPELTPTPSKIKAVQRVSSLVESNGIMFGTAVSVTALRNDRAYAELLAREFNILTPENAMKFAAIHPGRNTYNFNDADFIVNFAEQHNIKIHGHNLVWHKSLPEWLTSQNWSRDELISILKEHIMTVVGHYRGRVVAWDVINEAVNDDGTLRDGIWLRGIGPDYIEMAFRWAHEADPNALLFYNDYGIEGKGKKADALNKLAQNLLKNGVPINGIGMEMHVRPESCPTPQEMKANIDRLASLGLQVYVTEMDVRLQSPITNDKLAEQAQIYSDILNVCLSANNCKAFIMWGFTDKYSWIPSSFPGWESGLIFDESYQPKPAYTKMNSLLLNR